jgi:methionine-rich copper-binding protein CopC
VFRQVLLGLALFAATVAPATPALAHSMVRAVSIEDGARLNPAPTYVTIAFEHAARFGSVQLATAAGERVPITYKPPTQAATTFTIPLPRLAPDAYRLSWRVIAEDAHVMTGAVSFTVVTR